MPVGQGFEDFDFALQVLKQLCGELAPADSLDRNLLVGVL